jgi:large conductance mechanosensitive channel
LEGHTLKDFKAFILRGNIVDLAVAVVIGTAFTALVNTMVGSVITPILNRIGGGGVGGGLGLQLGDEGDPTTFLDIGAILNAAVVFLLTAAVVFFVIVKPMQPIAARRRSGEVIDDTPAPSDEAMLLTEIRDLLQARQ